MAFHRTIHAMIEPESSGPLIDLPPEVATSTGGPKPSGQVLVVGVDTSDKSLAAFHHALAKSTPEDQIKVFHCEKIDLVVDHGILEHSKEDHKKQATVFFEKLKEECRREGRYCEFESKSFVGGTGAIGKNICDYAMLKKADTVVVGNRELSRLGRTLVGSVSGYLAQSCPTNLVVVKRDPLELMPKAERRRN